jgi:hypothetical protein
MVGWMISRDHADALISGHGLGDGDLDRFGLGGVPPGGRGARARRVRKASAVQGNGLARSAG